MLTNAEVALIDAHYRSQAAEWETAVHQEWSALLSNDPDTVLAHLAAAFEDNEAAAAGVGVAGEEVSLLVVVPPVQAVPERRPTTTAAGNLSLKKLTKRETADFYKLLVCGHMLVTLKECFAVAPGLNAARIVAVRPGQVDSYGRTTAEVIMAAGVERTRLFNIRWASVEATTILNDASAEIIAAQKGITRALQPLDLDDHPDLADLVAAVDIDDMWGQP